MNVDITTADLCNDAGITYRQLDFWIRSRYVRPVLEAPGSGTARTFTDAEADVVKRMGLLTRLGLHVSCAHRIARSWAEHPTWPVHLGEGVTLRMDDWHPEHPHHADYAAAFRAAHTPERTS